MIKEVNILGIKYKVKEVEVVNKYEPRKGEINYINSEIKIDVNMSDDVKEQVLMHEILHGILDGLGMYELSEDENKVQSIATALHQVLTSQNIFRSN